MYFYSYNYAKYSAWKYEAVLKIQMFLLNKYRKKSQLSFKVEDYFTHFAVNVVNNS